MHKDHQKHALVSEMMSFHASCKYFISATESCSSCISPPFSKLIIKLLMFLLLLPWKSEDKEDSPSYLITLCLSLPSSIVPSLFLTSFHQLCLFSRCRNSITETGCYRRNIPSLVFPLLSLIPRLAFYIAEETAKHFQLLMEASSLFSGTEWKHILPLALTTITFG